MEKENNISPDDQIKPKPIKRRSRPRRATTQDCLINMAEARREIALALNLHRSMYSSSSSSCTAAENKNPYTTSTISPLGKKYSFDYHDFHKPNNIYCCYSLMESMPVPEPIWSTTAPSVSFASNSVSSKDLIEYNSELEYLGHHDQNQASSYAWWVGFLKSLDDGGNIINGTDEEYCYSKLYPTGNYSRVSQLGEESQTPRVVQDVGDKSLCSSTITPDEWLSFSSTAEDDEADQTTT